MMAAALVVLIVPLVAVGLGVLSLRWARNWLDAAKLRC
jgi:hypothetical protein